MPRADDPRVVLRLSPTDAAVIEAAAESAGVATGALVRECAVRYAAAVAREVVEGRLKLRGRSGRVTAAVPVEPPDRPVGGEAGSDLPVGVRRAMAFRRAAGLM